MTLHEVVEILRRHGLFVRELHDGHIEGGIAVDVAQGIPVLHHSFTIVPEGSEWVCTFAGGAKDLVSRCTSPDEAVFLTLGWIDRRTRT
jgi:hypothetical protein